MQWPGHIVETVDNENEIRTGSAIITHPNSSNSCDISPLLLAFRGGVPCLTPPNPYSVIVVIAWSRSTCVLHHVQRVQRSCSVPNCSLVGTHVYGLLFCLSDIGKMVVEVSSIDLRHFGCSNDSCGIP